MSDYNRDWNPNQYDKYGNLKVDANLDTGRGPLVLLAMLALIGLVGGVLYIDGMARLASSDIATAPAQTWPTTTPPAPADHK